MVTDLQVPRHTRLHVCQRGVTGDHVGELGPAVDNLELSLRTAPHPDAVKLRRIAVKDGAAVGVGIASKYVLGRERRSRFERERREVAVEDGRLDRLQWCCSSVSLAHDNSFRWVANIQ